MSDPTFRVLGINDGNCLQLVRIKSGRIEEVFLSREDLKQLALGAVKALCREA